jgi:mono/diheme cytochrome c family protein
MNFWEASRRFFYLVVFAGGLSACDYSIEKNPGLDMPPPSQFKVSELNYSNVYGKVIRANCVGCHGSGGGISLESYELTKSHLKKIFQSVFVDRRMPKAPGPSLSANQLGLLNAWIQAGAPESAVDEDPTPVPPMGPTFEAIRYHIFETKCLLCHSPGKPAARISLVTKEDILESPLELAIPGNADESGLFLAVISENVRKIMPPPKDEHGNPTGLTKLSDAEIQAIYDWIQNGATD